MTTNQELRRYVIDHIERDIAINRSLSGIDFSMFMGEYIPLCTSHQYMKILQREGFRERLPLIMASLGQTLSEELKQTIRFSEAAKAGVAITQIYNGRELDKLDEYAIQLATKNTVQDNRDFEANNSSMKTFTRLFQGFH